MTLPIDPYGGAAPDAEGDDQLAEAGRRLAQRERLREEVRKLEEAERFAAALQAIRDSGLASRGVEGLQSDIARLRQAARLQERYRRACAAREAGDGEAAALLAAVVAVDPRYKDAARLLYETVSGGLVAGLEAEVAASREAASLAEGQRDRLACGRVRLLRVVVAQGVALCALCALLGWVAWRRPSSPAANGSVSPVSNGMPAAVRLPASSSPEAISPVIMEVAPTPPGPEASIARAAMGPVGGSSVATGAAAQGIASSSPSTSARGAASADRPPELEGPCRAVGESCWSSVQCCFGSMCYGTTCQDTRRTIVFGQYRP